MKARKEDNVQRTKLNLSSSRSTSALVGNVTAINNNQFDSKNERRCVSPWYSRYGIVVIDRPASLKADFKKTKIPKN